jgi:hypothetical protein
MEKRHRHYQVWQDKPKGKGCGDHAPAFPLPKEDKKHEYREINEKIGQVDCPPNDCEAIREHLCFPDSLNYRVDSAQG